MKKFLVIFSLLTCLSSTSNALENIYFTDSRDNKSYKAMVLNGQMWMVDNLAFNMEGSTYPGNDVKYIKEFGRLYNGQAAQKACPKGWRLASLADYYYLLASYCKFPYVDCEWKLNDVGFNIKRAGSKTKPGHYNRDSNVDDMYGMHKEVIFWTTIRDDNTRFWTFQPYGSTCEPGKPYDVFGPIEDDLYLSVRCIKKAR